MTEPTTPGKPATGSENSRRARVAAVLFWITAAPTWFAAVALGLFITLFSFDAALMPEDLPWAVQVLGCTAAVVTVPGVLASVVAGRRRWLYVGLLAGAGYFTLMSLLAVAKVSFAS